ncbi:MAG TPA: hypothetical protein VMT76_03495 [Puia sp.]|nr:hypothetical protein [Puia sp.]
MNNEELLIADLKQDLQIEISEKISLSELKQKLAVHINNLINHDFEKLVGLLYRIDINESKLKNLLQQYKNKDAGILIAGMIIERQLQKIKTRKEFSQKKEQNDEERW